MSITRDQGQLIEVLKNGGIAVIPTDTLWGIVAATRQPAAVKRLGRIRQRDSSKPFITLIADLADLAEFKIEPSPQQEEKLKRWWPGPVSVILGEQAFRLPASDWLRELLRQTGPLVAPSANLPGQTPAQNLPEAQAYFGDQVDIYYQPAVPTMTLTQASTLVKLSSNGDDQILRSGAGDDIVGRYGK